MRKEGGFSYLIAMFLVAVLAIISVRALENSLTAERRDKEAQLLMVGKAYRDAIRDYYEGTPGTAKAYPAELELLLLDTRPTRLVRRLRKLYRDPVTGSAEWGIVRSESGGVMGVFSLSTQKPYKSDGFPIELMSFTNAKRYQDWRFVYQPN
ncbi:type II secretion system protein [Undibacterium sp.]|jgi:hypothetical protein|uniref:type II secretion system protein n=1 Tax=Undibacterium sp. TaxID=1914977 RepID=UPI002B9E19A0|nr:type II secretion system protein [Undibacterium sp.]HTD05250.1 type II secretion system protein [Undibacterium sp.]